MIPLEVSGGSPLPDLLFGLGLDQERLPAASWVKLPAMTWIGAAAQPTGPALQHDGWVRGRLRSILRKRAGRRGRGRGPDQQRWTNQYFACRGLFSLHEAQVTELQSHG